MSDRCFVDTNILLYAHDASQGSKHARARELVRELWNRRCGVLSTQVLQELCFNLQRKLARPLEPRATREVIEDYLRWQIVQNTEESVLEALGIQERYMLRFWDALIVQAAEVGGAAVLYSEDFSHGQAYGSVRVVNPFLSQ